jgi:hypothetical protein
VNPGGEPERDETGLPPVDIEIPDDARDLDRDVQAYYREQRALRRQQRGRRMRGSLARDGIVLPLLACCLILALITGTLLTVFTATSDQGLTGLPGTGKPTAPPAASAGTSTGAAPSRGPSSAAASPGASGSAQPSVPATPDVVPGVLPRATIAVDGRPPSLVTDLRRAALVLVPSQCNCTAAVSWLVGIVTGAHARTFLVYTASTRATVMRLYASLSASERAQVLLASEPAGALSATVPDTLPPGGLTAVLVGPVKVAYATGFTTGDDATTLIQALTH